MEEFIRPSELMVILVIILVLFGGAKLPEFARNLGRAQKELREGFREGAQPHEPTDAGTIARAETKADTVALAAADTGTDAASSASADPDAGAAADTSADPSAQEHQPNLT